MQVARFSAAAPDVLADALSMTIKAGKPICPNAVKNRRSMRWLTPLATLLALLSTGCTMFSTPFSTPSFKFPSLPGVTSPPIPTAKELQANYVPVGATAALPSSTFTQEVYQSVRNAKANNSIVLQVLGDDVPIRVLPLPSVNTVAAEQTATGGGPPTVYVSNLLDQTGVMRKLGKAQAALYRSSPNNFEGIRMDVIFAEHDAEQIRPESDYALRPGDRLVIRKDTRGGLGSLIDMVLDR